MTTPRPRSAPRQDEKTKFYDPSMRANQLASTVRQGRKITIQIFDEDPFSGYLGGWDADTYFVIIPSPYEGKPPVKRLVERNAIQYIDLADEGSFREEEDYDLMNPIVRKFKGYINNTYFVAQGEHDEG